MSETPSHRSISAWRIVMAMRAELERQKVAFSNISDDGEIIVNGRLDIAALAHATETALRMEFGA